MRRGRSCNLLVRVQVQSLRLQRPMIYVLLVRLIILGYLILNHVLIVIIAVLNIKKVLINLNILKISKKMGENLFPMALLDFQLAKKLVIL